MSAYTPEQLFDLNCRNKEIIEQNYERAVYFYNRRQSQNAA